MSNLVADHFPPTYYVFSSYPIHLPLPIGVSKVVNSVPWVMPRYFCLGREKKIVPLHLIVFRKQPIFISDVGGCLLETLQAFAPETKNVKA